MKKNIFLLFSILLVGESGAQLSGILNVPASYTSIASVISAINQQGISGSLTINIAANYTETAPLGGYSLTVTGSATSPVTFKKNGPGANPLISAYSGGSGTPGSMNQDGIWRLIGCDYITFDGIDLRDPNTANPATMEFGYGFFKANANDGCQNNTIKNCVITLNKINNAGGTGPAVDGSRGIDVVNAASTVHNAAVSVNSFSGSNSNNKFYSNKIQNCNIGISLIGFADSSPFSFADTGNDVGGNSISTGNSIIDFGGGGTANAAAAIRTLAQYNLNVSFNVINNNTGSGIDHPVILRGIYLNAAASANTTVSDNTLTLHGGGTSSQLSVIENASGSTASSNTVNINNNLITNCTYANSTSGPFYGIWNTASPENLNITNNSFSNNSTSASSGSTYLIYNNGAVASLVNINNNNLSFNYIGPATYAGNMYNIYNGNGTLSTSLTVSNNNFSNYNHLAFSASGNIYFIYNTNDSYSVGINNNSWTNLSLNHSGAEYLINNNSSTQSLLTVNGNSINGTFNRTASAGATYLYYSTGSSPATCLQTFSGNNFSGINAAVAGSGVFYGIYNADGVTSPYPKKIISNNVIANVNINSSGIFYGYYVDSSGDGSTASGSTVYSNTLSTISRAGIIYGIYISGTVSPTYAPQVYSNVIQNLNSSGTSSNLYAAYLAGGGAGLNFYKNKISDIIETGSAGLAHGVYITSAVNTTLSNNFIGKINAPNSSATNAVNGVYINGGTLVNTVYNTIYLNATSTGGNFNSNALYCSSTTNLNLRNNILVNISSGGTGVAAAYRRSSTVLTNYLSSSNNNLFYAGTPGPNNIILQTSTTGYQTLTAFQTAVTPRETASISQNVNFLNTSSASPNFLRVTPNLSSAIESGAINISGITDDYDNQTRHGNPGYSGTGTAPDIGADEYNQNLIPCNGANAGTISPTSYSLCTGQSISLYSNGYTPGTGLIHQWKISTISGGPYANVAGGVGASTPEFISASLVAGTYYFVMVTTCTNASLSAISAEATVVVNAIPLALAGSVASLVCAGQSINLLSNLSSGSTYQWTGPNGFNASVQNPTITNSSINFSGIYYLCLNANGCVSPQSSVAVSVSDVTLAVVASASGLCLGNSATLTLNTSATTYTWNTGVNSNSIIITPTTTTVYSVAVTNTANCTVSKSLTLSVINPIISANNTVVCGNSAAATISVNAFTPSVVNWYSSPASTISLGNGTNYSLTVVTSTTFYAEATNSISGCQSIRIPVTITLSANPTLIVSANPAAICPGKSSTLTATGATTFSYVSIGSGSMHVVSPLSNHVYTLTGKNALGCSSTETVLVSTNTVAIITTVQTATSICPSSVVGFTASGANSYYWNTGSNGPVTTVTPATNSSYTVYGINTQSCTSSATLAVVTRSMPVLILVQSTNTVCPGEAVTFTATGASSYTWLPGSSVSQTYTANPLISSVYNAIGKSINTCTNVGLAYVTVDPCDGIGENELLKGEMTIFPNPSNGIITILFNSENEKQIQIYSSCGNLVFKISFSRAFESIDLSAFSKGIYFIRINYKNKILNRKLILE